LRKFSLLILVVTCFSFGQMGEEPSGGMTYEVTITNLTKGQIFSHPVVLSHSSEYSLFQLGQPVSGALAELAEDGLTQPLIDDAMATGVVFDAASAETPLPPGQSTTLEIQVNSKYDEISVTGMLVITNDAFFALRNAEVKTTRFKNGFSRPLTFMAEAYDAGSEANTELCSDIPGPPCNNMGVRVTEGAEGYVYIHSGITGDQDVGKAMYDWRSSVAMITIRPSK